MLALDTRQTGSCSRTKARHPVQGAWMVVGSCGEGVGALREWSESMRRGWVQVVRGMHAAALGLKPVEHKSMAVEVLQSILTQGRPMRMGQGAVYQERMQDLRALSPAAEAVPAASKAPVEAAGVG